MDPFWNLQLHTGICRYSVIQVASNYIPRTKIMD